MSFSVITEDNYLERVDEYTLYCFYLGFEPELGMQYTSPLRDNDDNPSFRLFEATRKTGIEFMWKDPALGVSGTILDLVRRMYGYPSKVEALRRILSDFKLGERVEATQKLVLNPPPKAKPMSDIRVKPRLFKEHDLKFWEQFHISEDILRAYRVSSLFCYWLTPLQRDPVYAPQLSYIYRIYDRYQLYFPKKDRKKRFLMDLHENYIMGVEQLTYEGPLIITKSYKDVMCLRSYGYDSVSPRGESIPMPDTFAAWAAQHYEHIYVLFDNDGKHRADWYPYPLIQVPPESGSKDISDYTRDHGHVRAANLIKSLL